MTHNGIQILDCFYLFSHEKYGPKALCGLLLYPVALLLFGTLYAEGNGFKQMGS